MIEVRRTRDFGRWLAALGDALAQEAINRRITRLEGGLFGDVKFFSGIGELRINFGPGYRLYFVRRGNTIVILLCGGDKSTQKRDIARAIEMAKEN